MKLARVIVKNPLRRRSWVFHRPLTEYDRECSCCPDSTECRNKALWVVFFGFVVLWFEFRPSAGREALAKKGVTP